MKRIFLLRSFFVILAVCLGFSIPVQAMTITKQQGWSESLCVEWSPVSGAAKYQLTYSGEGITDMPTSQELIRQYPDHMRADVPGLKAGSYTVTIKALSEDNSVIDEATSFSLTVKSHVREGFAFTDGMVPGGYNLDGTPKAGAKIIYLTHKNANTVTCQVAVDNKGPKTYTGLANILKAREKGYDDTPLIIRIIGCIKNADVEGLKGGNDIPVTGADRADNKRIRNITIEGVGNDATLHGIGIHLKRSMCIEIRNLGIMLFGDDAVQMEGDNAYNWVHNCDFFYGAPGSDSDQKKGDGSIDMKYNTTHITISYNHFWDNGKCTFAGGTGGDETTDPIYFTYHHNWFDHCDSRLPRLCRAWTHIYNNYNDGNPTMCVLATEYSCAFVEANYYRNCPWPLEMNAQGTNRERWPNASQTGGFIKAFNNKFIGNYKLYTQNDHPGDYDAYVVFDRNEKVPETEKTLSGGNKYSNFDTADDMYSYSVDAPEAVPAVVMADAGRMEGGDLKWIFSNETDDASSAIIDELKTAITNYESKLVQAFVSDDNSGGESGDDPVVTDTEVSYAGKVFLCIDKATSNATIAASSTPCLAYGARYIGSVIKPAWYSGTNSGKEINVGSDITSEGFLLNGTSKSDDGYTKAYGGLKVKNSSTSTFWVTGTTGVAIYGCGASGTSMTLTVEEVAADGSLTTVGTTATSPQGTAYATVEHASPLDASKYYKVTVGADYSRECVFHQIHFLQDAMLTGIREVNANGNTLISCSNSLFGVNLAGQRVSSNYGGIIIRNGKKILKN